MYFFIAHFCAFCNQAGGERADWKQGKQWKGYGKSEAFFGKRNAVGE